MPKRAAQTLPHTARSSPNYLLAIIALIVLLCLAVGISFGLASSHLDAAQRWLLTAFLILFPVFGVAVSLWLILRHARKLAVAEKDDLIPWRIMTPEDQRSKLTLEVNELATILEIPANQLSDLRSAYIVAEDLALRKIEQETKLSLMRHIAVEAVDFDAAFINRDVITFVEVAFLVTPHIAQEKITEILRKLDYAKKLLAKIRPDSKLKLMLALVTQFDEQAAAKLPAMLRDKFAATPVDVIINPLDFEELQKIFASD